MFEAMKGMPDSARAWVYGLNRPLTPEETTRTRAILDGFVSTWLSHGARVEGAYELVENRFVVLAGFCPDGISGCSTDSSVHAVRQVEKEFGVGAFDRTLVFYRDERGGLVCATRDEFKASVDRGQVSPETRVIDATVQTVGDLRRGDLEKTFSASWHARAFSTD